MKALVKSRLEEPVTVRSKSGSRKTTVIDALLLKLREQAMAGNWRALLELMKLYSQAVPDETPQAADESNTPTDQETLNFLGALFGNRRPGEP